MVRKFRVKVNGKEYVVEVEEIRETKRVEVPKVETPKVETPQPAPSQTPQRVERIESSGASEKVVKAPMGGTVMKVLVKVGDEVKAGDTLIVFETMKMENELKSPYSGKVKAVNVKEGDMMETGQIVVVLE